MPCRSHGRGRPLGEKDNPERVMDRVDDREIRRSGGWRNVDGRYRCGDNVGDKYTEVNTKYNHGKVGHGSRMIFFWFDQRLRSLWVKQHV